MNVERDLLDAYREWRRIAIAEGRAIQMRDWRLVLDCQEFIKNLQPKIAALTVEASEEWNNNRRPPPHAVIRSLVLELIAINRRNQELLETIRSRASNHLDQLAQTGRNLKRLQRSYASRTGYGLSSN